MRQVLSTIGFDKAGVEAAKLRIAGGKDAVLGKASAPIEPQDLKELRH